MAVMYCEICDRYIDLDYDVEHEEFCAFEHGWVDEDTPPDGPKVVEAEDA